MVPARGAGENSLQARIGEANSDDCLDITGNAYLVHKVISQTEFRLKTGPSYQNPDGEINDSQREAWIRSIEVFDEDHSRQDKLAPESESLVLQDYFDDGSGKEPRYYQSSAINKAIEAIAKGQNRILLVMATGTGKTYTAFQIIWRLWKAGRKKRILFLADRNVLIDQTMVNDFRPFGPVMAKLSTGTKTIEREDGTEVVLPTAIDKKRRIDTSYEVYLGLYQAITGPEESQKLFREFSPGFFDLIVIDECHRGSAAEDSACDLFDLWLGLTQGGANTTRIAHVFHAYLAADHLAVSGSQLRQNLAAKMTDAAFLSDVPPLLRPGIAYDATVAHSLIERELLTQL